MLTFLPGNLYHKVAILLVFLCLFSLRSVAQQQGNTGKGKITGRIIDSVSRQPLSYVSIGLLTQENKEINGVTSDDKGQFKIDNVAEGNYKLVIYFVGYKTGTRNNINILKTQSTFNLGDIPLASQQMMLKEITVTSKAPVIENKIDKIVYNVANDITSQGGAAIDVLKKVPQITVDVDGNVELQGNSNIRFLINGKPSSVFGNSLADALASIPASQIKSIEAITSPGAKYDAQGTGGIINIILKDNKVEGINGNFNLSAGTRFENAALNLNFRHNHLDVNAFFSGNMQLTSRTPNSQNRTSADTFSQTTTHLLQDGYTDFERNGYRSGIGFEWSVNKKNSLGGSATYNQFGNRSRGLINQEQVTQDLSSTVLQDIHGYRNSDIRSSIASIDLNLNYRKQFAKEGQELNILYSSSYGTPNSNYIQSQTFAGGSMPYIGTKSNNPGTDNQTNISLDYTHPVKKTVVIETGLKRVEQNINSATNISFLDPSLDQYENNLTQSYHLKYDMKVYAGYLSVTFSMFNWLNIRAGARAERTDIHIDFPNTTVPSYTIVVPSLILSHQFSEEQSVKLSYTKRIERPEYSELNPFLNLSDPHNITTGNPLLRPEIGNNFELGYNRTFNKGGSIYLAFIERINSQDLKPVTMFYSEYKVSDSIYQNVSVTKRQNVGTEYNSGFIASGSLPATSKLNIRGNLMITHRYIVTTLDIGNVSMGFRYRFNLNLTYQLPKDLIVEAFGNYNSATLNIQGKMPQSVTYTFALRKQFWNKKASIGLTATNPFNQYISQVTTTVTDNYTSYASRMLPYRSFGITFTYKFGKLEFKKSKEDGNDDSNTMPVAN